MDVRLPREPRVVGPAAHTPRRPRARGSGSSAGEGEGHRKRGARPGVGVPRALPHTPRQFRPTGTVGTAASCQDSKTYWVLSTLFWKVSLKNG